MSELEGSRVCDAKYSKKSPAIFPSASRDIQFLVPMYLRYFEIKF
jgi:hypothetical protein